MKRKRRPGKRADQATSGPPRLPYVLAALRRRDELEQAAERLLRGASPLSCMLRPPTPAATLDRVPETGDNSETE